MRISTLIPIYHPFFRRFGLSSYLLSDLTVLAANIFSDPVLFRASVNEHSSLTQRDCHYFMTRMTSAGVIYAIVLLLSNYIIIIVFVNRLLMLTFFRWAFIFCQILLWFNWYNDSGGKIDCCYNILT